MEAFGETGAGGGTESTDDAVRTYAELFAVLGDERRLRALACLREDAPTTVTELAEAVAARERRDPYASPPREAVRKVAMSLHHAHLPKLGDAEIVEFDSDAGTVALGDDAGDALAVLDAVDDASAAT